MGSFALRIERVQTLLARLINNGRGACVWNTSYAKVQVYMRNLGARNSA